MKHSVLLILILSQLACVLQSTIAQKSPQPDKIQGQIQTETPEPSLFPSTIQLVQITGAVYVRDSAGVVRGNLPVGKVIQAQCAGDLCTLQEGEYSGMTIWRGCTSEAETRLCLEK